MLRHKSLTSLASVSPDGASRSNKPIYPSMKIDTRIPKRPGSAPVSPSKRKLAMAKPSPEFHGFLKLPKELRLKIWAYAAKIPQTIIIDAAQKYDQKSPRIPRIIPHSRVYCIPAILHVNQESRAKALQYLQPVYQDLQFKQTVFINYDLDTVIFCSHQAFKLFRIQVKKAEFPVKDGLKAFENGVRDLVYGGDFLYYEPLLQMIPNLPNLKRFRFLKLRPSRNGNGKFKKLMHNKWRARGLAPRNFPSLEYITEVKLEDMRWKQVQREWR